MVAGSDRLTEILIPTLKFSIESMLSMHEDWHVDVYLILGYVLKPERKQLIIDALPQNIGLQIWEDASPIYYDVRQDSKLSVDTRALSRQHRFVIKDKYKYYDFFSCWEDDMRITGHHINHFLNVTKELEIISTEMKIKEEEDSEIQGPLSHHQTVNAIPGFIRVEVLQKEAKSQNKKDPIAIADGVRVNGEYCCSELSGTVPKSEKMILWETGIAALGVRKFPGSIGWIAMLPGSKLKFPEKISTYWSGNDGAYGKMSRPGGSGNYFANAAGIMLTRKQVDHLDSICPGKYLPPFSDRMWRGHRYV